MNIAYILLLVVSTLLSCKNNTFKTKDGGYVIGYNKDSIDFQCGYLFNKESILEQNLCQFNGIPNGFSILYYPSGVPESVEYYEMGKLAKQRILYHESGIMDRIIPYSNGKINGELFIYDPKGELNAVNLFENDSLYYIKVYKDNLSEYGDVERIIPIILLERDSAEVNDTIKLIIRIPFNEKHGITPGRYSFHYNVHRAEILKHELPLPIDSSSWDDEAVEISVRCTEPGHYKFYCVVKDENHKYASQYIFRDLYIMEKDSL